MSRLPFELVLALRYLRPKRTFVSIITLISVTGVALGVAVLIIVISVMSGFDQQMREIILGFNTHLSVFQRSSTITNYAAVMNVVASNRNVKGVAPVVLGQVLLETQPATGQSLVFAPTLRGVDPQAETNVTTLPSKVIEGQFDLSGRGLVVGSVLARNLSLQVGDRVSIYSPRDFKKMKDTRGKKNETLVLADDYEIRGIVDIGYYEYDATLAITSLENAQEMYDLDGSVHDLMVMLHDPFDAVTVRRELEQMLGPEFRIVTWLEQSPMLAAIVVEKNVMLYILFFIVLVAAFGITCTLITFVVQKTKDIGILKAVGASSRGVMWIFLSQSMAVCLLGILAGVGLGILAVTYRNEFLNLLRRLTHFELFPASIYGFSELPALIQAHDIAIICGGSLLICVLAAAFPVWHASRLKPVEALRYE